MVDYDACNAESEYFEYIEPNCKATCGLCTYDQGTLVHHPISFNIFSCAREIWVATFHGWLFHEI